MLNPVAVFNPVAVLNPVAVFNTMAVFNPVAVLLTDDTGRFVAEVQVVELHSKDTSYPAAPFRRYANRARESRYQSSC